MSGALVITLALTVLSAPSPLKEGVKLYHSKRYAESLEVFAQALNTGRYNRKKRSLVHTYIGLIQLRFDRAKDARRSFETALSLFPKARLPKRSSKNARRLWKRLKRRRRRKPKQPPPPPPPPPPIIVQAPPPPPPPPPPPVVQASLLIGPGQIVAAPDTSSSTYTGWGWAGLGLGGAAVVASGVLGGLAVSDRNASISADIALETERLHNRAITRRNTGIAVGATGASMAITGLLMLLLR